jgi:hypothetical protein
VGVQIMHFEKTELSKSDIVSTSYDALNYQKTVTASRPYDRLLIYGMGSIGYLKLSHCDIASHRQFHSPSHRQHSAALSPAQRSACTIPSHLAPPSRFSHNSM